jgi:hypothetical protein
MNKTNAEPQSQTAPVTATPQPALPEKEGGSRPASVQRASLDALPPPDGTPPAARAAGMLGDEQVGTAQRAHMMRAMQGSVGSARVNRMIDAHGRPAGEHATSTAKRMAVQRQNTSPETPDTLPPSVTTAMQAGGGQPLDQGTRAHMEPAFGTDLSSVRVHTDSQADRAARDINAKAFTTGQNIFFAGGQHQPDTAEGQHLLAHELTHTVQQGSGMGAPQTQRAISQPGDPDEQQAEKIAEQITTKNKVPPGEILPGRSQAIHRQAELTGTLGMAYEAAVIIGKNSVYELKGSGTFQPNLFLQAYIADQKNNALVNVRFGDLAKGKLFIEKIGKNEYRAAPSPLPMAHPDISAPGGGQSLSLIVSIGAGNEITGSIGVTKPLPPNSIGAAYGSPEDQERFLALLIGQTASHGKVETKSLVNELKDGKLRFIYTFANQLYQDTGLIGSFLMNNEALEFNARLFVDSKGLQRGTAEITRDRRGTLFARKDFSTTWEAMGFKGALKASYEDGVLDIRGTLKYESPRVKGEINVLATEEKRAWQAIQSQLEAIQPGGAGASEGGKTPAPGTPAAGGGGASAAGGTPAGADKLALTGWGVLKLAVTDKIDADAAFVADPDGYLTVRGTIRAPHKITLMDAKPTEEKTFFDEDYSDMEYVGPAVGIRAKLHIKFTGKAVFGPLTLHDIVITGAYSTRPGLGSELEISAKLNLSGSATAKLAADGELALRLGTKYKYLGANPAALSLTTSAEGEVRGVVEAQPTIKRQTKGKGSGDETPKYTIGGQLFVGGEADIKLTGDLVFTAAGKDFWEIHLGEKVFPIGGFGLTADVAYTLGSDDMPKVNIKKGDFEPHRFIRQAIRGQRAKDTDDQVKGGFKEGGKEKGHVVPSDAIPDAPPQQPKTQVAQFTMDGSQHTLFLTLGGPGEPVLLEMASTRGPLKPRISRAQKDLIDAKYAAETDEAAKRKIERRLDDLAQASRDASRIEQAAARLGNEPEATHLDVPGFKELGDELQTYGERYHVRDLAEPTPGQAQPTGPAQPSAGTGTDPAAEEVMSSWPKLKKDQQIIDQVRRILNTGNLPQAQFRQIMDKAKINGAAATRLLNNLEQLTVRAFAGLKVVLSDLEIGGNKFRGAAFMLEYIGDNNLWGSVTEFEAPREDRRIDAIIRRTQYEFKSWGEFRAGTFLEQIGKDYERTGLRAVRWVLQKRELGDKEAIVQLMTDALKDKELIRRYGISQAKARLIIDELDRIVIVY